MPMPMVAPIAASQVALKTMTYYFEAKTEQETELWKVYLFFWGGFVCVWGGLVWPQAALLALVLLHLLVGCGLRSELHRGVCGAAWAVWLGPC